MKQTAVLIIGGGFVGLSAGLILSKLGLRVTVLDAKPAPLASGSDGRAIALAYTSVVLMKNLGVWPHLDKHLCPIDEVITSEAGHFNKLRIRASELGLPYLGQICPAPILGQALYASCQQYNTIEVLHDALVTQIDPDKRIVHYVKDHADNAVQAQLILCCDGTDSALAKSIGFIMKQKSYHQTAWVANVSTSLPHQHTAIERFTDLGTLALLPLPDQRMTVVLSLSDDKIDAWRSQDPEQQLKTLQSLLGNRFGTLSDLGKTFEYPLQECVLDKTYQSGLLCVGNAVHTINPIAAQGLNLSWRDLSVLSDILKDAMAESQDIGSMEVLSRYDAKVKPAHQSMLRLTDFLVFISKHKFKYARSLALGLLNITLAKGLLAKTLAGISSHRGSLMDVSHDV
jgi:2-octaprenyl-6-methoxyphenol hydroxylase